MVLPEGPLSEWVRSETAGALPGSNGRKSRCRLPSHPTDMIQTRQQTVALAATADLFGHRGGSVNAQVSKPSRLPYEAPTSESLGMWLGHFGATCSGAGGITDCPLTFGPFGGGNMG